MPSDQANAASAAPVRSFTEGRQTATNIIQEISFVLKAIKGVLYLFVWALSLPSEVFLHHKFGLRYLNLLTLSVGVLVLIASIFVATPGPDRWVPIVLLLIYIPLATIHILQAWRRYRKGIRWHSRCAGLPYPFWKYLPGGKNPFNVVRYYEPALLFAAGVVLGVISTYGGALMIFAVAVFLKRWLEAWQMHGLMLDQIDKQIESEMMVAMLQENQSAWDGEGFVVPKYSI